MEWEGWMEESEEGGGGTVAVVYNVVQWCVQ